MTEFDLKALGRMAKLDISETEEKELKKYMAFLTDDFEKLKQADTGEVKPLIHGIELKNVFRDDKPSEKTDREMLLKNAPDHEGGYFKVPKTLE